MKTHILRLLGMAIFFLLCYHLDALLDALFEQTDFFAAPALPAEASWWDRIWASGKTFIFDRLGDLIEFLLVLCCFMWVDTHNRNTEPMTDPI